MQQTNTSNPVERIAHRILDVIAVIVDRIARRDAPIAPLTPAEVAASRAPWRWANDRLGFWKACVNRRCRRARCCRGEPRACLARHLPQVPDAERKRALADLRAIREGGRIGPGTTLPCHPTECRLSLS